LSYVSDCSTHDSLSSMRLLRLRAGKGSRHDYMSTTKSLRTHKGPRGPTPEIADYLPDANYQ